MKTKQEKLKRQMEKVEKMLCEPFDIEVLQALQLHLSYLRHYV